MNDSRIGDIFNKLQVAILAADSIQAHPSQGIENEQRAIQIRKNVLLAEKLMREELGLPSNGEIRAAVAQSHIGTKGVE